MLKKKLLSSILIFLIIVSALVSTPNISVYAMGVTSISSGSYTLAVNDLGSGQYGIGIYRGTTELDEQTNPLILLIKDVNSNEISYQNRYTSWANNNGTITCTGSVTTANGSRFDYTDIYTVQDSTGAFRMSRNVIVGAANANDKGFATKYSIYPLESADLTDYNIFAPGNWYKQNASAVKAGTNSSGVLQPGAFGSDYSNENFYIKETRLPLPVFSMQAISSGETITFGHINANLTTSQSEMSNSWLVDAGFQFGSIGVKKSPTPSLNYVYPSSEGDTNYYGNDQNRSLRLSGMVRRSHPVQANGVSHSYSIVIKLTQDTDYANIVSNTWNYFVNLYNPVIKNINPSTLYANDIIYYQAKYRGDFSSGAKGLPWSSKTVESGDTGYHMQSGFVGQQTKAGWQLLRDGIKNNNSVNRTNGEAIINFWVDNSMTAAGIPKTDYFAESGNWGGDPLYVRVVCDAGEGVLDAYNVEYKNGSVQDNWLIYCQKLGDFLVRKQDGDGSWARSYNPDGSINGTEKYNTTNGIRFLTKLYLVTHDTRYKTAAINAGNWALTNINDTYNYAGGAIDNNSIDKEAGVMALNGFNSLYDLTGDSKWLSAAKNAATYIETWTYTYNYNVYPATRWAANGCTYPSWLTADLGSDYNVKRIETMFEMGNLYYKYKIETSSDNINWTTFIDKTGNNARPEGMGYVDSGNTTGRYVRITITGVEGSGAWPSIYEFKVYGDSGNDLAQGKMAIASSEQNTVHDASKAVDGTGAVNSNSPWPDAGLIGQSLVATGHTYTDTFMVNGAAEFYRLYLFSGDANYLKFAKIYANNSNAAADYDGRLGYQYKALFGEGIMCNNFSAFYGDECLTWQLGVQLESICTLEDMFGYKNIDDIESNISASQKQALNHLNYMYGGFNTVNNITNNSTYKIVNRNSGKLIEVANGSTANGGDIQQNMDQNDNGQRWKAVDVGSGFWKFINMSSGKVIDVEGSSLNNGTNISQYTDSGTPNQHWSLTGIGNGFWKIVNKNSGKLIDVENSSRADYGNISQYQDMNTANQQWVFYDFPQGVDVITDNSVYKIVNKYSGKLLDVEGSSTSNGGNISQYHDLNGANQKWRAVDVGGGYWKFININSGKVIDVEGYAINNSANISQYTDSGTTNQQWSLTGVGGGYWKIINRNSGKLIDVEESSSGDGKNVSQYQDMNMPNQQWAFVLSN